MIVGADMSKRREPTVAELKAQLAKLRKERVRAGGRKKMPARKKPKHAVFYRLSDDQLAFLMKEVAAHLHLNATGDEAPTRAEVAKGGLLFLMKSIGFRESAK